MDNQGYVMQQQPQPGGYQQPPPGGYQQPPPGGYQQPPPVPPAGPMPPGPPQVQWMQIPTAPAGCPPGLEYLAQIDQLIIKQQVELLEVFTGWESANRYKILNSLGQQVYFAAEESDACMRQCCGPARSFTIHITDNAGQEVMRLTRPFKCCAGCPWYACCDACSFNVDVEAPVGTHVGSVRQECSPWSPVFSLRSADGEVVANLKGPCCIIHGPCCPMVEFDIFSATSEDTKIGSISKNWTGMIQEAFTDADTFQVSFPMDMDIRTKATFLGAVFLIDFMFFEQSGNQNH